MFGKKLQEASSGVSSEFLTNSIEKFQKINGISLSLVYLDNLEPHANAFLAIAKANKQQIKLIN